MSAKINKLYFIQETIRREKYRFIDDPIALNVTVIDEVKESVLTIPYIHLQKVISILEVIRDNILEVEKNED